MLREIIISSLLGGLLSLDVLVAFQFMLSRPLVAACLTGLALGEGAVGLSLGCLMELIWIGVLPVGRVVPPDFTLAAVFGTASAVIMHSMAPELHWEACVVWALLWSIPLASLSGLTDVWHRRRNFKMAEHAEKNVSAGDEAALGKMLLGTALLAWIRAFLFTALALLICVKPMTLILTRVVVLASEALDWIYWLGLLLGFVVALDHFWERRWLFACAASFVLSALGLYAFGLKSSTVLSGASLAALLAATLWERRSRA